MASSQMILDKTCLNDFGFATDICNDLQHHDANNTVVQVIISYCHVRVDFLITSMFLRTRWLSSVCTRV